jgi:prolyl-tRNA synthetase
MRQSKLFAPTLKEAPSDAVVASHVLLVRGGFIRQIAAGVYAMLPLAWRVLRRVEAIVREEMDRTGAQEFHLPAIHPKEIWEATGRWDAMGPNMFRLQDRGGRDMCLGMTHEEVFTHIAKNEVRSYRELPMVWYQIQTKFRDEPRPKSGVLRVREFTMKDAYSFDVDRAGLDAAYEDQRQAYCRIFERCGVDYHIVEAHSGAMGGSESAEFMVRTDAGEDLVAACPDCGYAANTEKASSRIPKVADPEPAGEPTKFATPDLLTIEDLAKAHPDKAPAQRQIKTLVYALDGKLHLALVRGDHELNEAKLQTATGAVEIRPAHREEIREALGADPGSLGGVGVARLPILADAALEGRNEMVTGANEDGFHLEHVSVARDLSRARFTDLRTVKAGEGCTRCEGTLEVFKALEVGHIFKLGTRYSEALGATVLDADGKEVPIIMGSYGIGVERVMAAAVERHHDENGIAWPAAIAPFSVHVLPLQANDEAVREKAEAIYRALVEAGIDALLDDRDERAGVKFKDSDLIGVPVRVAIGSRGLKEGKVELKRRTDAEVTAIDADPESIVSEVRRRLAG